MTRLEPIAAARALASSCWLALARRSPCLRASVASTVCVGHAGCRRRRRFSVRRRPARARSRSRWPSAIGGEIVNCDSTAVYRGFDIGTDKVPLAERRGIPHHLIDIVDPTERVHRRAVRARRRGGDSRHRRRAAGCRFVVGGTGFYYRALTRGLFPGPGTRRRAARAARGDRRAARRARFCIGCCARVDPASARAHPAARSEADRARARGVLPDRPAVDDALRRDRVADPGRRGPGRSRCGCRRPRSSDAGDAPRRRSSSRAGCSTRSAACWRAAFPRPRGRSAASSTARRSSICTACATRRRRAR